MNTACLNTSTLNQADELSSALTYMLYRLTDTDLSNSRGYYVEARLRVTAHTGDALDSGAVLIVEDGTRQFAAFLRSDAVNLAGGAAVPLDMTTWRRVRLQCVGDGAALSIDEDLRQRGTYRKASGYQRWAFGTFGSGTVDVEIDWIRGRKHS